jgi:hypothetical protein
MLAVVGKRGNGIRRLGVRIPSGAQEGRVRVEHAPFCLDSIETTCGAS